MIDWDSFECYVLQRMVGGCGRTEKVNKGIRGHYRG